MTGGDGFLSRWSRRKRAAEGPEPPPDTAGPGPARPAEPEPAAEPAAEPAPLPTLSDDELAALPRIEDLTPDTDIRVFLRPGVPVALKNAAMRRMWLLTPAIRDHRDPAVDYAWDWNTPGGVPGDGCGPSPERAARMLRDLLDPPEPRVAEPAAAPDPAETAAPDDRPPPDPAPEAVGGAERSRTVNDLPDPGLPRRRHGGALPS
jgi:hypothetical protein